MIDLGAEYAAAIDVYDESGSLVDPATATLTITRPDGTSADTSGLQVPPTDTGKLRFAYTTEQPGRHIVKWATTDPVTTWRDVFDVGTDAPPSIVSLADAKVHLQMDASVTTWDDELRAWLAGVTAAVEDYKHQVYAARSFTEKIRTKHHLMRLWHVPVLSLDSVTSLDGSTTWDTDNLDVDDDTGLVRVLSGNALTRLVNVTYTAGYRVIPYNVIQASLVLLQHVWETQRGMGAIGAGVIGAEEMRQTLSFTMMPRKVIEWLGPPDPVVA